jgi:phosphoglycerol transferase
MYPAPDNASWLALKLLTALGLSSFEASNLYFLIGFPVCFALSFAVLRKFKLNPKFSSTAALLYTFLPFHFYRFEHLTYTWYFVVPVYFMVAFKLFSLEDEEEFHFSREMRWILLMFFLSCFGVYYSLFGLILIVSSTVVKCSRRNVVQLGKITAALTGTLVLGSVVNLIPNIWFVLTNKTQVSDSVLRSKTGGDVYSFRLIQLLLPNQDHLFPPLRTLANSYNLNASFVNENRSATLGVVGSVGLMILLFVLLRGSSGYRKSNIWFLASVSWLLFLVGTTGGFGPMATYLGLESIRGWNRISVFVAFGCIAGAFLVFQYFVIRKWHVLLVSILVITVGLLDQVGGFYVFRTGQVRTEFVDSQKFVRLIENSLPVGSAVYNLPYTDFPEPNPTGGLAYENGEGFIHSKSLRWSYGANKSTEGAKFFGSLASESIATQIRVIKRLGFNGVYLDLRGFGNDAKQVKVDFLELGMVPMYERADGNVLFFRIFASRISKIESLDVNEIEAVACYQKRVDGSYFESC